MISKIVLTVLLLSSYYIGVAQNLNELNFNQIDSIMGLKAQSAQFQEGINLSQKVREADLSNIQPQDTIYAKALAWRCFFYKELGVFEIQEELLLKAIKITEKTLGYQHSFYALLNDNLGGLYIDLGQLEKASFYVKKAMKIKAKIYGKNSIDYAISINTLASVYYNIGNLEEAEVLFLDANKRFELLLGKKNYYYATTLSNLSNLYEMLESYAQAEPFYLESINEIKGIYGAQHPAYAGVLSKLASLYIKIDSLDKAEALLLESKAVFEATLGKTHNQYGAINFTLAQLYEQKEDYDQAEKLYKDAINNNINNFGSEHPVVSLRYKALATLYKNSGNIEAAETYFKKVIEIDRFVYKGEHPLYAESLAKLAELYIQTEQLDLATYYCFESLAANSKAIESGAQIQSEFEGIDSIDRYEFYSYNSSINTIKQLCDIYQVKNKQFYDQENTRILFLLATAAIRIEEKKRNKFSNDEDKLRVVKNHAYFVQLGIEAAIELESAEYIDQAFTFAEHNKSTMLSDAIKGNRARSFGDLPDSLVQKEQKLQQKIANLKKVLFENPDPSKEDSLNRRLSTLNLDVDRFLLSIKEKYPQYHRLKYENITVDKEDVQQNIDDNTLLIEYFITDSTLFAFAVSDDSVQLFSFDINSKVLKRKIKTFRESLSNYKLISNSKRRSFDLFINNAYWFYSNILQPILDNNSANNLVIVADGELGHLPFETFLTEDISKDPKNKRQDEAGIDFKHLPYLIHQYTVSYNYSATLWNNNLNHKQVLTDGRMLACAPNYEAVDSSLLELRLPYYFNLRSSLQPLPASKNEVLALQDFFSGDFLIDSLSSEAAFKEKVEDYAIVHLAMHGTLNQRVPMLSSLVFAENMDSKEDNFLQAYEISKMNLNAEMVVLSACETGFGKFEQGEGVISLARSFMYAGVPSLVVSLWQVNDISTSIMMQYFYENLAEGMHKDIALREAKLKYLNNSEGIACHPAFWSPFIQLGNSQSVYIRSKHASYYYWALAIVPILLLIVFGIYRKKRSNISA